MLETVAVPWSPWVAGRQSFGRRAGDRKIIRNRESRPARTPDSMPKVLTITGFAAAGVALLISVLDLAIGIPLGGMSKAMDIGFLLSALLLAYLSWSTFRELT